MAALTLPCILFKTKKGMDDYNARDMKFSDLSETLLKRNFHLSDVSTMVNPYTLTRITPFTQPYSMFHTMRSADKKITRQECASILFDEFRHLSQSFAIYGPYKHVIKKMISHLQYGNGTPFKNISLDWALKEHLLNDRTDNSTLKRIGQALVKNIDWGKGEYPVNKLVEIVKAISSGKLPKFNRFKDNYNGMGITIHDTWSTQIAMRELKIVKDSYYCKLHYKVQDHFGLDNEDIMNPKYNIFRFFRIWFVLQIYDMFCFRPFMTNMESLVEITGNRSDG